MTRRCLCRTAEIAEGDGRSFRFGEGTAFAAVLLLRKHGVLHAYRDSCPHRGTPLDFLGTRLFDSDGEHLLCRTHGARFRAEDGFCVSGPCAGQSLTRLAVGVENGEIVLWDDRG